ncbi:hypothetical protein [Bradyrhizobium prioriisuperbiae]|uniref:hypothetical protein n=1 Tax=Bradyrhizobium prioriisuperbiae TaxID=2854389 RepID=UPI0028F12FDD|nr:hypothetical protein [Bradyrhizobium prioritasuperba]
MSITSIRPFIAIICVGLSWLAFAPLAGAAPVTRSDGAELVYAIPDDGAQKYNSAQNPALSPDGTTLIFTLYINGYDGHIGDTQQGGLARMPSAGGAATPITATNLGGTNVNGLATWNGATNLVTFADTALDANIWTVAPDGSGLRQVTYTTGKGHPAYQEPTFSPDGKTIVFEEDLEHNPNSDDGYVGSIDIVPTAGGPVRRLLVGGNASDNRLPVWSPDGSQILFQRRTDMKPKQEGGYHLFTINPDGTGLIQITGKPTADGVVYENYDSDASWSPDGQWILDSACYGSGPQTPCPKGAVPNIFLISVDGKKVVRVTTSKHEDGAPVMSPDGRWIYFESHKGDEDSPTQIWRIATPPH